MNARAELRLPPHAIEAEQSVLGALMLDNAAIDRISALRPEHFYRDDHRRIFSAIGQLIGASKPADVLTVFNALESSGDAERVGGLAYLGEIANNTPSAANIEAYARRVRDTAVERALIATCDEVSAKAFGRGDLTEKLDFAQQRFAALDEVSVRRDPAPLNEVLIRHIDKIQARFEGEEKGLSTGFPDLDERLNGMHPGQSIVIAGRPAMGKSTLAVNIAVAVAEAGVPALICSQEMSESDLADRLLAQVGRIALDRLIKGTLQDDDWHRLTMATGRLNEMPLFIDEQPALTLWDVRAKARQIRRRHGLGLVVIDYLQLMKGEGDNRTQEVGSISRGVKQLAKDMGCPVILLSQLNRGLESRPNKRPMMSDLRESGEIEQDADVILFIYRDEVYHADSADKGLAEIIVGKARQGAAGGPCVRLAFHGEHSAFRSASHEAIQAAAERAQTAAPAKSGRKAAFDG